MHGNQIQIAEKWICNNYWRTGPDYIVPEDSDEMCFRRIVFSGQCESVSEKENIRPFERKTIQPTVFVTQPTCQTGTGIIKVTSPSPAQGTFYSIDGQTYTNTTGIFEAVTPGSYTVTAKLGAGECFSAVVT
jgi:hypothetical protein